MPTPNPGESEHDYVSRCIPIVLNEGTAADSSQAAAICHSMWREAQKVPDGKAEFWVDQEQMRALCPSCADTMAEKGLTRVNLAQIKQEGLDRLCERFDFHDPGWFTSCVNTVQDYSWVDNPEALCARLHYHCLGFWPGEHRMMLGPVKALELSGEVRKLLVLGAPYYGPNSGKDDQGEYFDEQTDFMTNIGDKRPVIYLHGRGPNGGEQPVPEVIGEATAIKRDERGMWFEVILEKGKQLAERVWKAAKRGILRASTGAVSHLVRSGPDGHLVTWPIGELSLLDLGGGRAPANEYAVAMPLKTMYAKAGIQLPEAFREADEAEADAAQAEPVVAEIQSEEIKMTEGLTIEAVLGALDARDAAKKAEEEKLSAIKADIEKKVREELEAKTPAWKGGFSTKKVTELGLAKDDMKAFSYWLRTGDMAAVKAALAVGTASTGGVLVPDDFYNQIVKRQNELSWLRQAGVTTLQTSRDVVQVPWQSTTDALAVVASEAGAYSEVEPTFDQVSVTIHKFTNLIKVSEELLADEQANLETFLANHIAEKFAITEGYYAVLGSGSSQPLGVAGADSDTVTIYDFASAAQIEASEIKAGFYTLNSFYRGRATWVMSADTEAYLRSLETTTHFAFEGALPFGENAGAAMDRLLGRPVVNQDGMASIAASAKVIVVGDWSHYFLCEHGNIEVTRNPYLYQANGQVGIFSKKRWGGAPVQTEAFVVMRQSA